jgi:hypothetical protein
VLIKQNKQNFENFVWRIGEKKLEKRNCEHVIGGCTAAKVTKSGEEMFNCTKVHS